MMAPASRLLAWAAVAGLPLAMLLPWQGSGGLGLGAGVVVAVLAGLVAIDAWRGRRRAFEVEVRLPEVCRLPVGRPGRLPVSVRSAGTKSGTLLVGLQWPQRVRTDWAEWEVVLPAGEAVRRLDWPCTALQRGIHALGAAYAETRSPWGLWRVRRRHPARCELRVYPDLLGERRQVAALFLNRGLLGVHTQRVVGRGREFEKLREYSPGDSYEDVHWKSTAKRGRPVTKLYQVERTQEVYVVLDLSRLSGRPASSGFRGSPKAAAADVERVALDRFVVGALVVALAAGRQGDLFGLLTFSDRVHAFLRARNGRAHYQACREVLLQAQPRAVAPDFEELFTWVRLRLRRRALLVVLTALDDPVLSEAFVQSARLVERQHLVLVNGLRPAGVEPMFTQPELGSVEELYEALGGHLRWHQLSELQERLQRRGIRLSLVDEERLSSELVRQYVEVKRRQLL